jgi:hypothetical protein
MRGVIIEEGPLTTLLTFDCRANRARSNKCGIHSVSGSISRALGQDCCSRQRCELVVCRIASSVARCFCEGLVGSQRSTSQRSSVRIECACTMAHGQPHTHDAMKEGECRVTARRAWLVRWDLPLSPSIRTNERPTEPCDRPSQGKGQRTSTTFRPLKRAISNTPLGLTHWAPSSSPQG